MKQLITTPIRNAFIAYLHRQTISNQSKLLSLYTQTFNQNPYAYTTTHT